MRRLLLLAALVAAETACITIGDPIDAEMSFWWLTRGEATGDCPVPAAFDTRLWTVWDEQEDVPGRRVYHVDPGLSAAAGTLTCDAGEPACHPWAVDDGAQILHATVVGATQGTLFDAEIELIGTCGPYCGVPGPDTSTITCEGSAPLSFERMIGGRLNQARPDAASCDLLTTPQQSRGAPHTVWLVNASSTRINVYWHNAGASQYLNVLNAASVMQVTTWVGDRFELQDVDDGACLRAFDVTAELDRVITDSQGGR